MTIGHGVRETEVGCRLRLVYQRQSSAHHGVLSGPSRPWCVFVSHLLKHELGLLSLGEQRFWSLPSAHLLTFRLLGICVSLAPSVSLDSCYAESEFPCVSLSNSKEDILSGSVALNSDSP